ncbi:MAG TPA: Rrf2 family transcriptional regulator [Flavobacteriaceae bacterium]|nr:Rrf2 family transcriptional regulator [Flavobacteriaceae bacterium]
MIFSKACEYGIRATLYIAQKSVQGERTGLKAISKEIGSPEAFTAKILQKLVRSNIIESTKGPYGGFQMSRKAIEEIKLVQIVEAIDGGDIFIQCGLGLKECSETHPCPVHDKFKVVRNALHEMMNSTSIFELSTKLEEKSAYLKR